jgi:uncharacterized protein YqgC (DUF456 family)
MDLITAIRKSLTGFVCGIFGVLPVIGIIPAMCAVSCWSSVRRNYRNQWNPAKVYLLGGLLLAAFGILSSAVIFCVVLFMCVEGT